MRIDRRAFVVLLAGALAVSAVAFLVPHRGVGDAVHPGAAMGSRALAVGANDAAQVRIADASHAATLVRGDGGRWVVREAGERPADPARIAALLQRLQNARIVQIERANAASLASLALNEPARSAGAAATGTRVDLLDADGKRLGSLLLGKALMKTEDSPLPVKRERAVARYALRPDEAAVLILSDPLEIVDADPAAWSARDAGEPRRPRDIP